MRLSLAVVIILSACLAAAWPSDATQARFVRQGSYVPISAAVNATTLYERVTHACWQLTSEPERICPPRYDIERLIYTRFDFDGWPPGGSTDER